MWFRDYSVNDLEEMIELFRRGPLTTIVSRYCDLLEKNKIAASLCDLHVALCEGVLPNML